MALSQTVLQSERISFSLWRDDQIDDVIALHRIPEVYRFLSGREENREDAERRLAKWHSDFQTYGYCKFRLTDRATGQFLGLAGFGVEDEGPELGYALLPQYWGKGLAVEAAVALRDWIFTEREYELFIGYAYTVNTVSTHILKKIGMTFTHIEHDEGEELSFYKLTKEQWHG